MNKKAENTESVLRPYDYTKYDMKTVDRAVAFLIGFAAGIIVMHIFFGNIIIDIIVGTGVGIAAQPIFRKFRKNQIQKQLTLQFKDMLDSINSSVSAGKVINSAFIDAEKDMEMQYGAESHIYKELRIINYGVMSSRNIEEMLLDFGERSGIDDIISFANVFAISNRRGGNMKTIIGETKSILCDKIDIEQEIHTMVNASKNQLNVMMAMPLLIVPMMSSFSSEGDNEAINVAVKIGGIIIFIVAYIIGRKITNIKI